jgi:hypothetical protein
LSWIIKDLWKALEAKRGQYEDLIQEDTIKAFEIVNQIASEVGGRWGVFIQLNFPPGRHKPTVLGLGHRDLTLLVYRDRKKFDSVSESEVKQALGPLNPLSFDSAGFGYEGFRVRLPAGRIDCLPGGVHLWCEITPEVLGFLDWLFSKAYELKPFKESG